MALYYVRIYVHSLLSHVCVTV